MKKPWGSTPRTRPTSSDGIHQSQQAHDREGEMTLQLIMWNVQHGSAIYINTPNGKDIAIDLGADDNFSPLQHILSKGHRLDHATITHPHMDHIDDILNFDPVSPGTLLAPKHLTESDIRDSNPKPNQLAEAKIQKYLEIRNRYSSPISPQEDIKSPQNNGGVSIETFIPYQSSKGNLNNHSVVTTMEYSGVKILIPGDNESSSWEELLKLPEFRSAIANTHVLVAAHHGRESGFHRPLFDHFNPLITLISDGRAVGTSVTGKYNDVTRGWKVRRRNGATQERKCVTTRNDGHIEVSVDTGNPIGSLSVLID